MLTLRLYYRRSQNHQYALKLQDPFPAGWEPFFINCNDSSVEGIKSTEGCGKKVWGVQFHPESAGGPLDTIEVSLVFAAGLGPGTEMGYISRRRERR